MTKENNDEKKDIKECAFLFIENMDAKNMRLRDYFAAKALNGLTANHSYKPEWGKEFSDTAKICYKMADAMLAERKK